MKHGRNWQAAARTRAPRAARVTPRPAPAIPIRRHLVKTPAAKEARSLELIGKKIQRGRADPKTRALALSVLRSVPERNERAEVEALARHLKSRVRFTRDPYGVEYLADLHDTLNAGAGDCDGFTVALGQLAGSVGYPVRARAVGDNGRLGHIVPEVFLKSEGRWQAVDLASPGDPFQFPPPGQFPLERIITPGRQQRARAGASRFDLLRAQRLPASLRYDPGLGSWLSKAVKKVVGKKAGKKIEKTVNNITRTALSATQAAAAFIPVPGLSEAATAAAALTRMGADPAKASWDTISWMSTTSPAAGMAMAQAKLEAESRKTQAAGGTGLPTWTEIHAAAGAGAETSMITQIAQDRAAADRSKGMNEAAEEGLSTLAEILKARDTLGPAAATSILEQVKATPWALPAAAALAGALAVFLITRK